MIFQASRPATFQLLSWVAHLTSMSPLEATHYHVPFDHMSCWRWQAAGCAMRLKPTIMTDKSHRYPIDCLMMMPLRAF